MIEARAEYGGPRPQRHPRDLDHRPDILDRLRLIAADDAKKLQFQINVFRLKAARASPKEGQDMTPEFGSRSFMIIRSSMIIFAMTVGMSISTNADTVKVNAETVGVVDNASTNGSFTIAQTNGINRRGDRRDTRQDCRGQEGVVGADKRNCKQQARQSELE